MLDWYTYDNQTTIVEWQSLDLLIEDYAGALKNINNIIENYKNNKSKQFVYYVAVKDNPNNADIDTFKKPAFIYQKGHDLGGIQDCICYYFKP